MKVSLVSAEQTRRHPANNSPSKYACSFSRGKRFLTANPEYLKLNKGVPEGKRSDFTKSLTCSPASTKYKHQTSFTIDLRKGHAFGCSRDKSLNRSYISPHLSRIPGPGQYEDKNTGRSTSFYSMRVKTCDFIGDRLSYKESPGPGTYKDVDLNPNEYRFKISKFSDARYAKINPNSKRFKDIKQSPGPGDYLNKDNFSNEGAYILSQHRGEGTRPFNKTARVNFTETFRELSKTMPGPSSYEKPSDFGVYGDVKYYKNFNSTTIH